MSRGGFRGRGRGGGGPGGAFQLPSHSDMNKAQWAEALREPTKHSGMLYPPLETSSISNLPAPDAFEQLILAHSLNLSAALSSGIPQMDGTRMVPWRLSDERKVVGIEIETYSELIRNSTSKGAMGVGGGLGGGGGAVGSSKLDPKALYLDSTLFPPVLWTQVFEGAGDDDGPKRKKQLKGVQRKARRIESGSEDEGEEKEKLPAGSDSDQDDAFEFEDESDHQDYDANYFDNGEGDDDSGGDEDEGGGGGYDD